MQAYIITWKKETLSLPACSFTSKPNSFLVLESISSEFQHILKNTWDFKKCGLSSSFKSKVPQAEMSGELEAKSRDDTQSHEQKLCYRWTISNFSFFC